MRSKITWIDEYLPDLSNKTLVTLSMEGCIPELKGDVREANVKGGLGIYFGDKLEGLKAIGMKRAFGCMPLYKKRIVQAIRNGRQHLEYREVSYMEQPIEQVTDIWGLPLQFEVWGWEITNTSREKQYNIEVYSIYRGGTLLYLFYCPEVFDVLYPDDKTHYGFGREHRFLQETIFAECVYTLLKTIDVVPDILHLNEGHVADAAAIIKGDKAFEKTSVVYTNHTVVPAGLERYYINRLTSGDIGRARYAMRFLQPNYEDFWHKFSAQHDGQWLIDFSKGALEICDVANGVSNEHAYATQSLFPAYNRRVEGILNGSGDTWIMDGLLEQKVRETTIDNETLIRAAQEGKTLAFAEIQKRTAGMTDKYGHIISENGISLSPDLPTIWMVRRMVRYKSQLPLLKDIIHAICANKDEEVDTPYGKMKGLQMQVVVGGIAPDGSWEEGWVEEFISWMQRPELRGRFVYVPNADTILLKMQAVGADICINCPLPEQEACGTSDQRTALNGGINIATRSGGPLEYIEDGVSGMLVGPYQSEGDFYYRAPKDILEKLRQLSEMYYNQNNGDNRWLDMKLESYLASSKVTAAAMEQRYADLYAQALHVRKKSLSAIAQEQCKTIYVNESPELVLQLQEAASILHDRDAILKNWNSGSSILKNKQFDGSFLLFCLIDKYLELIKNDDYLEKIISQISSDKQISIVQFMLKEIMGTYLERTMLKDRWQEDKKEESRTVYASVH